MFRKLLIANRGEIAVRIARTARELGVASVAVYPEVDRESLHVRRADEAISLGGDPRAYLDGERLVDTALASGCDSLHPGYGFLSENADFAELCAARGVAFIGPPSQAIRTMGEKQRARAAMAGAGVPIVPGGSAETLEQARAT
ncbi:MAG TPA: biotin carboxylase N-terminal domain-containing protein, partial [Polyangiaceae bacterium]